MPDAVDRVVEMPEDDVGIEHGPGPWRGLPGEDVRAHRVDAFAFGQLDRFSQRVDPEYPEALGHESRLDRRVAAANAEQAGRSAFGKELPQQVTHPQPVRLAVC